jgi:ABC-2 type transport system permease protein
MPVIFALAQKDLRILFRLRSGLFFTFVWPVLVAVLFGLIFSGEGEPSKIQVVVVDEDGTSASAQFVSTLEKREEIEASQANRDQALTLVRQGKRTAAIVLPRGFGDASGRMFYGQPARLEIWIDPSRKAESAMLQGLLFQQAAQRMQESLSDTSASQGMVRKALNDLNGAPGSDSQKQPVGRFLGELDRFLQNSSADETTRKEISAWQPLKVEEKPVTAGSTGPQPHNAFDITFPQGILWGIIGCVMTFGIGIVSERTQGTMVRLQISPITRAQLLAGKALACFTAIVIVQAGMFFLGRFLFHVRPSSWGMLALAGFSAGVGFVGIMMLVAGLGKTEQAAAGAGWAVMLPISMLGGGMIPLFLMPRWMSAVGNVSPAKWAVVAFEGAIWRGFSLHEMLLPCGILILVGMACFAIGTKAFRSPS